MLELPEAMTLAKQLEETCLGKTVEKVVAGRSPHRFAFFYEDAPENYPERLEGRAIEGAKAFGGQVEIDLGDATLTLNDGAALRLLPPGAPEPAKHQLYLRFTDASALVCTIQMYGGLYACPKGTPMDFYKQVSKEKPSPLTGAFDYPHFCTLMETCKPSASLKAFLATEQRIPGLGNGVLQDILFRAGYRPRTQLAQLTEEERQGLFMAVKETLACMAEKGGRDTEKDLYGNPGGYHSTLSQKTWKEPCPNCLGPITRQAYLGGNVYFCPHCQK